MKVLLFILFLVCYACSYSQDTLEICNEESITKTFFSGPTGDGENIWTVEGIQYVSDELTYTFTQPGIFTITLRRENGLCYAEEYIQITVSKCDGLIYWVPNAFTPDSDENNQTYGPVITSGIDLNDFVFSIYNRWGEIIWESRDPSAKWDGTYGGMKCQDGIYMWKLQFNVFGNDDRMIDNGHVTILR
jgi:gliding motility-associated-like protein